MSVFATLKKKGHFMVPGSRYIKTENEPDKEDTKPSAEPVNPIQTEAK